METNTYLPKISFGIITAGKRNDLIEETIRSIQKLEIPEYEIILSGNITSELLNTKAIHCPEHAKAGQLGAMRNLIAKEANHEIVVICDDDISFDPNFYKAIRQYGPNFDVICPQIKNEDGSRYWDWAVFNAPTGHHMIPYNEKSPHVYITGGVCILKKHIFEKVLWETRLGFYENEDIDFSNRIKEAGFKPQNNAQAIAIHHDTKITQIEDFNRRLSSNEWSTHTSGLKLQGAFVGNPHSFSISDEFIIEVPTGILKKDLIVEFEIHLMAPTQCYFPPNPIAKLYSQDVQISEIILDNNKQHEFVSITIPQLNDSACLKITSTGMTMGAWNLSSRCRNIESYLIKNLTLKNSEGHKYSKSEIPDRNLPKTTQGRSPIEIKRGIKLIAPITTGNNLSRIITSIVPNLENSECSVSLEPRICTPEAIIELHLSGYNWLKNLTTDINCGTRIELVDTKRIPYENYLSRYSASWNGSNIGIFIDTQSTDILNEEQRSSFSEILNISSHSELLADRYFLPQGLLETCARQNRITLDYRPQKLIGIEISPWDDLGLAKILNFMINYNDKAGEIGYIMTCPEPYKWVRAESLRDRILRVANEQDLDIGKIPAITPLDGTLSDSTLFNTYRILDLLIKIDDSGNPLSFLPEILAKTPILSIHNDKKIEKSALDNLGIAHAHEILTDKVEDMFINLNTHTHIAEERLNKYLSGVSNLELSNMLLEMHRQQLN